MTSLLFDIRVNTYEPLSSVVKFMCSNRNLSVLDTIDEMLYVVHKMPFLIDNISDAVIHLIDYTDDVHKFLGLYHR